MSAAAAADVGGHGEGGGEGGGVAASDGRAVEVAELVGGAAGDGGPGSGDELAGDRAVGLGVAVASLDHEPPVELGELGIAGPGHVGGLVEREAQHGRAFLGDRPGG